MWPGATQAAPPTLGLNLPVKVVAVHDGDTVTVDITIRTNVRLKAKDSGVWAPELKEKGGIESRDHLMFAKDRTGILWIPLDKAKSFSDIWTMGRILGDIWLWEDYVDPQRPALVQKKIAEKSLGELQIESGHAARKKAKPTK